MVDNVTITSGAGTTIAADDVGGVLHQRVKLTWGPDGTANDADVASGKPIPVQLRTSGGSDVSGALPVTDNGSSLTVDAPVGTPAFVRLSDGSSAITTLPVSLASGSTGIAKAEDTASADADVGVPAMAVRKATPANTSGTDGDYEFLQISAGLLWTAAMGFQVTCSTDITRPADTSAYTANDAWADSTSAPASGGFTLTGAARVSGGSGVITDIYIASSAVPGTLLQGELHLFDSAATAVNDNAAWNLSDADAKLRVGVVSFTLVADANNSYYHAQNLNIGFTCVGTANLRYLVKVKNAYTPISGEVLTVRAKIIQTN